MSGESPKLRAAIVGLTGIAAGRSRPKSDHPLRYPMPDSHVASFYAHPRTDVVAVCDIRSDRLDEFRTTWSELSDVRRYTDYREMLNSEQIDILSIVTSDDRHADIVVDAAKKPVRGIICEKPIATTLADADRMIEAVQRARIPMSIEHTRRWRGLYHQIRKLLRNGIIGQPLRVVAHLGGPRAMLFRNGTHLIDMVNFLIESDPAWVFAELDEGFHDYFVYRGDGGRSPEGDPGGSGYVHYQNGVRVFFNCSKGTCKGFDLEIIGSEGEVVIERESAKLRTRHEMGRLAEQIVDAPPFQQEGVMGAVDEMVRLVDEGGVSVSPPSEGRKTLEVIIGFLESQRQGNRRVNLPLDR